MDGNFKSFNEIKGYTSIDLTSKTIDDILDYIDEYRKNNENYDINFPFKEGVIIRKQELSKEQHKDIFKNVLSYYYFKIKDEEDSFKILVEVYQSSNIMGSHVFVGQFAMKLDLNDSESSSWNSIIPLNYDGECSGVFKKTLDKLRQDLSSNKQALLKEMGYVISSLTYIDIVRNNREVVYKKAKGMTFKSSTKKAKATKTEKVEVLNGDKVMYVINGSEAHIKGFRTYTRKTDSWNVIGHWRHYKSGLVKWIEGYKKGNGKAKAKHYKVK